MPNQIEGRTQPSIETGLAWRTGQYTHFTMFLNAGCFARSGGLPIPRHIGIILEGNRRHGERHGNCDP